MILVTARMADGTWHDTVNPEAISDLLEAPGVLFWVDLKDPVAAEFDLLRREFGFHPLAIEDAIKKHQRPKVEVFDRYYFMVLYTATFDHHEHIPCATELDMFVGRNYVVTVREDDIGEIEAARTQWQRNLDEIGVDIGALVYTLVDRIVDDYFPIIDMLAERIEDIEEAIFEKFEPEALKEIFSLKKELLNLRRIIAPQRDVFNVLLRRDPPILPPESIPYFQDVYDHILRVSESLDLYRDLLSSALDAYLSMQGNRTNEVMYRLALISTIFLPLTFLTGFFGMNFESLPFANPTLFVAALLLMVVMPVGLFYFFRRRGWG